MCLLDDQGKPGTCLRMHQGHSKCCLLNHTLKKPGANSLPFNSYFLCKYIVEHMDETYYVIFKYSIYWNNNNNYVYLMALIIAIFYMIILRTTLQLLHMCIVRSVFRNLSRGSLNLFSFHVGGGLSTRWGTKTP